MNFSVILQIQVNGTLSASLHGLYNLMCGCSPPVLIEEENSLNKVGQWRSVKAQGLENFSTIKPHVDPLERRPQKEREREREVGGPGGGGAVRVGLGSERDVGIIHI